MIFIPLHIGALCLYLLSAVLYGANLSTRVRSHLFLARMFYSAGLVLHTAAIGSFCLAAHLSPFTGGFGSLSVFAWAAALLFLPIEVKFNLPALGALAAPAGSLLLFFAMLRSRVAIRMNPHIHERIISLHVMLALFAFALFLIAAVCAAGWLWQYRLLKHPDKRGLFRKLPPLETLDGLAFKLVAFAMPLLTLALALGIVRAAEGALRPGWMTDMHTLVSMIAWIIYGIYMAARRLAGWRGSRLQYLLITGLAVSLLLLFVPGVSHRFG